MIRTHFKKVLLVAPSVFPNELLTEYSHVTHISVIASIFPSIFELNPDVIVFDYEFMGKDMENILRRIKVNKFYNKVKICAYKNAPNIKTDGLLRVLGVDYLIYREEFIKSQKSNTISNTVNAIMGAHGVK